MKRKTACPFVNTLINENLIKCSNVSTNDIITVLKNLNLFDSILLHMVPGIVDQFTNSDGLIENINKHGGIAEHDVSLTRLDSFEHDSVSFVPSLFAQLKKKSKDTKYLTLDDLIE